MVMFDDYLKKLYRQNLIDIDTAISHANDAKNFANNL
jgi:Tfp pilus assembly pilus retraction ATPase PilT